MNTIKQCRRCNVIKNIIHFRKDKSKSDGHRSLCKICHNQESYSRRAHDRSKIRANMIVYEQIRMNKLSRPSKCSKCNCTTDAIEAHHHDYSKPKEIQWLCKQCHINAHGGNFNKRIMI